MVKRRKKDNRKKISSKGFKATDGKAKKIDASTSYETCTEQLSPFGGLLAMIKFLDLIRFHDIFQFAYNAPERKPKLGDYFMVIGILMLLFIGFNRLWHFVYIRLDAMLCGFFRLTPLPAASTFWRYVDSLGINQARSFLKIMNIIRERAWQLFDFQFDKIHLSVDTTVETVYGHQQGGRKGHNTKHRGKKGYRPVLCFIDETREYLAGKLRKGETIGGEETAAFISQIKPSLPGCVQKVLLRADGEFLSWQSVQACITAGFQFVIANKSCDPPFDPKAWYRPWKHSDIEYNSCIYKPIGWEAECRFVAMRIPKEQNQGVQGELFEENRYTYRIFCTNLKGKAHHVVVEYDKRADVENLVGEAKREGLDAIPSSKFKNNYAFFQIVMLAYNIWRYMKIMAQKSAEDYPYETNGLKNVMTNTIRIARLKLLFIAAKIVTDSNRDKVKYSIHDTRTSPMMKFLKFIDKARGRPRPWDNNENWPQRFSLQYS
jgi:hypothetical protein